MNDFHTSRDLLILILFKIWLTSIEIITFRYNGLSVCLNYISLVSSFLHVVAGLFETTHALFSILIMMVDAIQFLHIWNFLMCKGHLDKMLSMHQLRFCKIKIAHRTEYYMDRRSKAKMYWNDSLFPFLHFHVCVVCMYTDCMFVSTHVYGCICRLRVCEHTCVPVCRLHVCEHTRVSVCRLHVCEYTCVWVCMHTHTHGGPKVMSGKLIICNCSSFLLTELGFPSQAQRSVIWLSLVPEIPSPPSEAALMGRPLCPPGFSIDAKDLTTGPHTHTASALATEPSRSQKTINYWL